MLVKFFPRLGDNVIVKYLKRGLECRYSAILIAALILASNLFSWEIPMMYSVTALFVLATLFAEDMLCMMPFACGAYFMFSKVNNPLSTSHTSIFLTPYGYNNLWIVVGIVAFFVVARLVCDILLHKERRKFPLLSIGFIALGASYMLGGLLTRHYDWDTVLFGLTEIAALSFSYYYFYYTCDLKKVDKSYFAYLMTVMGFLLCAEVFGMLVEGGFFEALKAGVEFNRGNIGTGWGIYNNVAGAMIMCIPAPFYYATVKEKWNWVYLLLGNIFYVFILLIQSRGGMLFGTCIYGLCVLMMLWKAKKRLPLIIAEAAIFVGVLIVGCIFEDKIADMFHSVIQSGMNDSGRFDIYFGGLDQFLEAPVFGNGFYECGAFRWGDNSIGTFLPARYHNTAVQLIASVGAVGFLAYCYHRLETLHMVFMRERTVEKYFIGLCISGLLMTSLLDCHMFNFGPGFTYSALLLLLEIEYVRNKRSKKEALVEGEPVEALRAEAEPMAAEAALTETGDGEEPYEPIRIEGGLLPDKDIRLH